MKYMGSKNRISKEILPIILKDRKENQWYVEPFVGGANIFEKVDGNKIGNDNNSYLVALLKMLQTGYTPEFVSKDEYKEISNNKDKFPDWFVGWVGIGCSYSGKWFGGYAGVVKTKIGTVRNYQEEAVNNIKKQNFKGNFKSVDYKELEIPKNSIIYCDPPYANTTKYQSEFNHTDFWSWCNKMVENGHQVFVSEYNAPEDWECVWEKEVKSSLSANGKSGGNKNSIEKLFTKTKHL